MAQRNRDHRRGLHLILRLLVAGALLFLHHSKITSCRFDAERVHIGVSTTQRVAHPP